MYNSKNSGISEEYICDDSIYEPGGLMDRIRSMSDDEFEKYIKEQRKQEQR